MHCAPYPSTTNIISFDKSFEDLQVVNLRVRKYQCASLPFAGPGGPHDGLHAVIRTIADVLRPALANRPDAPAIIAPSGTLSYTELDRAASQAAGALWQAGLRPGDRVGACLPNDLDIIAAFHGAQRIGAIWVGINEGFSQPEQEALADLSTPSLILAGPQCRVQNRPVVDVETWARRVAGAAPAPQVELDPHAPAGIAFTSGTTGVPKGIVHSQWNMLLPGRVLAETRNWGPELRKGDCLALTLLNMLILTTLLVAQAEGCCILTDRRDVAGIAEWIVREHVQVWNGVPAHFYDLARRPDLDLSGLREAWCGGSACPEPLREAFTDTHPVPLRAAYGLTEAPTVVAIDPVGSAGLPGSGGQVLPHLDVAAYDEAGRRLPAGATGELRLSPAATGKWAGAWTPALGEWRDGSIVPTATVPFPTGDIGSVDADGWLSVVERRKLVIVRGGANVYPAEVEGVIRMHPAVAAAAVFAVPDERLGERVAVLVQLKTDVDLSELESLCRQRLARYKVPDRWAVVDALPTNAMGKVIRADLPGLLRRTGG
jgi:long-chain acyl-CoA synthetase